MKKLLTLKKNKEFHFVYRRGKAKASKDMTLVHVKSRYGGARVGFSVSKKIGNSVVRNLVRRRLKEAYRKALSDITQSYSLVFVARKGIENADFKQICSQMNYLLTKTGIKESKNS
ncbi:MAG: ribonuclease P protein component [Christensenellaceae bacterium]